MSFHGEWPKRIRREEEKKKKEERKGESI